MDYFPYLYNTSEMQNDSSYIFPSHFPKVSYFSPENVNEEKKEKFLKWDEHKDDSFEFHN